jgi:hypothetical protein
MFFTYSVQKALFRLMPAPRRFRFLGSRIERTYRAAHVKIQQSMYAHNARQLELLDQDLQLRERCNEIIRLHVKALYLGVDVDDPNYPTLNIEKVRGA